MTVGCLITFCIIQSNPYYEVTFGTKKKWSFKTGNLLKEVQFIWNFIWQDNKKTTYKYRWLLNRDDRIGRFDCILISVQWKMTERPFLILFSYYISNVHVYNISTHNSGLSNNIFEYINKRKILQWQIYLCSKIICISRTILNEPTHIFCFWSYLAFINKLI